MKKLTLSLDTLAVESFPTAEGAKKDAGTVQAYDAPTYPAPTCGCTTGGSWVAVLCPPPPLA